MKCDSRGMLVAIGCMITLFMTMYCPEHRVHSAPAPFSKRPIKQQRLEGVYTQYYLGTPAYTVLYPDGRYYCKWYGQNLIGTWKLVDGCIEIREKPEFSYLNHYLTYKAAIGGKGIIRLERR